MHLKSISFNRHKVLGSIKINFFENSVRLLKGIAKEHHTDIILEVDSLKNDNNYTYIIGRNGVGKTILFRTIINFINRNSSYKEPKLEALINLYTKSKHYLEYNVSDPGYNELVDLGIYNQWSITKDTNIKDFLGYYNSHLFFISSSFERTIVHKNPRYRNFNYLSSINKTQTLFLKALVKFNKSDKLKVLSELLDKKEINWSIRGEISSKAYGEIDADRYTILLNNKNNINIINFLKTVKKITISDNETLILSNLNTEELNVFEAIYKSDIFFKFFFDSNLSFKDFFKSIRTGRVLQKIEKFLNEEIDIVDVEDSLNVKIQKVQKKDWEFLFSNVGDLTEFEANTLLLLESLDLINLSIIGDDMSIEKMSTGEQSLIRMFSFFSDIPIESKNNGILVFFDEPENTLHPKWQLDLPNNFKRIVEEIYEIKKSHFIFSTHSPLIIMKCASVKNSNVLQFSKDENGVFYSQKVETVNAFNIEEVLLDEFKISYREKDIQVKVEQILKNKKDEIIKDLDPINSVEQSFGLKKKIDDLYNSLNQS
jgi:predicted ATPase